MTISPRSEASAIHQENLDLFWWAFALRGGAALVFAVVLWFSAKLLGTLFFDPVLLVTMSLMLGFYVFGNALLLGVGGLFAKRHGLPHWQILCAEAVFALGLAGYIGFSLQMTSESLAWLAALHCVGTGAFQCAAGWRVRRDRWLGGTLGVLGAGSLVAGALFLAARSSGVAIVAGWLSAYEVGFGLLLVVSAFRLHQVDAQSRQRVHVATGPAEPFTARS